MQIDYKLIGKRIKNARINERLSQQQLAESLGLSTSYISRVERGATKINLELLFKLSNTLRVSISSLLDDSNIDSTNYLDVEITHYFRLLSSSDKKKAVKILKIMANYDD